eukprot:13431764-Alexandrium_andersonii.AAC.1
MSASLVGSEMCIRDSRRPTPTRAPPPSLRAAWVRSRRQLRGSVARGSAARYARRLAISAPRQRR